MGDNMSWKNELALRERRACAVPHKGLSTLPKGTTTMRTRASTSVIALLVTVAGCATTVRQAESLSIPPLSHSRNFEPRIELWTTSGDVVQRGQDIGVRFRTSEDGFVVVGRIGTDGRIDILYPRRPSDDERAWGGETRDVNRYSGRAFSIDERPGIGYVFAIVSPHRLRLARYSRDGDWDYHGLPDVEGDPFVAMHHFAQQVVYDNDDDYSMDYAEYHVGGRYEYPRFVCYDCHHGRPDWDVYSHPCVRYHIVVYDEPEYYPYRHGDGRRVVYARPRYEFKVASNEHPAGKVEYGRRSSDGIVDRRRPGTPANDPNVPRDARGRGDDGATRPGDDTGGGRNDPRDDRRGGGNGNGGNGGGDHGDRPVRDTAHVAGGGGGGGGDHGDDHGDDGNGGHGNANGHRHPPVTGDSNGNGGDDRGNGGNGGSGGSGNAPRPREEPRSQPRSDPRSEPRPEPRSEPRSEPRQAPERRSEPKSSAPKSQPVERRRRP